MKLTTNLPAVINSISAGLSAIDIDKMTRAQATTLLGVMRVRIHTDGIASDGNPIGTYTPNYIKYTRAKAGRGTDNKVILSLTRSMEQSSELYPIPHGTGIGFSTQENLQKARWCEETYGKPIFTPTAQEKQLVQQIGEKYVNQVLQNGTSG